MEATIDAQSAAQPRIFCLLYEGPPEGHNSDVKKSEAAAASAPGLAGLAYHSQAEHLVAGNFSAADYARSLMQPGMLHWPSVIGMPIQPSDAFPTTELLLKVLDKKVPTLVPWIGASGYQDWYLAGCAADAQDRREQEDLHLLAYVGPAPTARSPYIGEFVFPSNNPRGERFTTQLEAMGYRDDLFHDATAAIFAGVAAIYGPAVPLSLQYHVPPCLQFGGDFDPGCAFAKTNLSAILAAAPDAHVTPMNDVIRAGSTGGWAVNTASPMCGKRLALQLSTQPREPSAIMAAYDNAVAKGITDLQVHPYQVQPLFEGLAARKQG